MIPVPIMKKADIAFGNINHLPAWKEIPERFTHHDGTKWNEFVSKWFFLGLKKEDLDKLIPKTGVDKDVAMSALSAILRSWAPKHEHKEAGAAYLMSEWFEELKE